MFHLFKRKRRDEAAAPEEKYTEKEQTIATSNAERISSDLRNLKQEKKEAFNSIRRKEEDSFVSTVDSSKYLVLDVETNGLSSTRDDLLSIAIYKPDSEKCWHRFLPLELNQCVLTTSINGITEEMIVDANPLSQEEVNQVLEEYDVDNRYVLIYGNIDERFMRAYFSRHRLSGIERFHFYNFKHDVISSSYSEGNVTKDNLCKLFFIENVKDVHAADNDCVLEWKLFRRMNGGQLFISNNKVFEFNKAEYIIPVSYTVSHPNFKYHLPPFPRIYVNDTVVESVSIQGEHLQKFGTNINGVLIEHLINKMVGATTVDSFQFLLENKKKLRYVGELESKIDIIPLTFKEDGTIATNRLQDKQIGEAFNQFIGTIKDEIGPLIQFIKSDIFKGKEILSQELVIDKEANILALCDLSSEDAVLEIKATDYRAPSAFSRQLYYEAKGRDTYLLQVDWRKMPKSLDIIISKIDFEVYEPTQRDFRSKFEKAKEVLETDDIQLINYINKSSRVQLKCRRCGYEWDCTYNMALKHLLCPICNPPEKKDSRRTKMSEEAKKARSAEKYYSKVYERSKGQIEASGYIGSREQVHAKCLNCCFEWQTRADHLLERCRCSKCGGKGDSVE